MRAIAVLFALVLTFPAQGVFCFFRKVSFSTPEQCGPFTVEFSDGSEPPLLPLSLTVVPISKSPISIQLPADTYDNSTNSGTARITFLPFPSGTQFIASLDDAKGNGVGMVSDVLAIQKSDATACLGPQQRGFPFYFIRGGLNQCSLFNVTFNPSLIKNFPAVRAFLPRSFSFPINATSTPVTTMPFDPRPSFSGKDRRAGDDDSNNKGSNDGKGKGKNGDGKGDEKSDDGKSGNDKDDDDGDNDNDDKNNTNNGTNSNSGDNNNRGGFPFGNNSNNNPFFRGPSNLSSKEYLLNVIHGFQAVLTFDDGDGHRGSSKLFTAGGTSSSPSSCFKESFDAPSPDGTNFPSSPRETGGLSRPGKIAISVLGACVGIFLAVVLFIACRRRRKAKKDLEQTSFVFTEDVDMGSSFVTTFASRIRARISQMTYGKRSVRSYRSYRDEKDGASTWIPTSPIGSPVHLGSPINEKQVSWVDFGAALGKDGREESESSPAHRGRTLGVDEMHNSVELPCLAFDYPAPPVPDKSRQSTKPDVPVPAVSRSSEGSRMLLGSGYLSSRSSETGVMTRRSQGAALATRFSLPPRSSPSSKRPFSAAVLSSTFSFTAHGSSRTSSATSNTDLASKHANEIYVSSPIRPTPDVPDNVLSSQIDSGTVQNPPPVVTRDTVRDSRYSLLKGSLRRDGPPRERGRILPFPIVSLRMSRSTSG